MIPSKLKFWSNVLYNGRYALGNGLIHGSLLWQYQVITTEEFLDETHRNTYILQECIMEMCTNNVMNVFTCAVARYNQKYL